MDRDDRVINSVFKAHGFDASYYDSNDVFVQDVTVIPILPDDIIDALGGRILTKTAVFEVRVSEISQPVAGAKIYFGGSPYIIQGKPFHKDRLRRVWVCNTFAEQA